MCTMLESDKIRDGGGCRGVKRCGSRAAPVVEMVGVAAFGG